MQFQYSDAKIVRNNDENKRCNEREATFIQTPLPKQGWAGGKPLQLPRRHPALSPRTTRYLRSHIPSSVTPQPWSRICTSALSTRIHSWWQAEQARCMHVVFSWRRSTNQKLWFCQTVELVACCIHCMYGSCMTCVQRGTSMINCSDLWIPWEKLLFI